MHNSETKNLVKLPEWLKSFDKIKIVFIVGMVLIGLIFCLDIFSGKEKTENANCEYGIEINEYKQKMEQELTATLKNMSGIGNVKVMITFESNQEIIYATEDEKEGREGLDDSNYSEKSSCVIIDGGEADNGLIRKIKEPQLRGVLVICDGGNDIAVKAKVTEAVKKLFSISSAKVCVTN